MKIPKIRDNELISAIQWAQADAEDDFCPDYVRYADYSLVASQHVPQLITSCLRPDMQPLGRLIVPRPNSLLSRGTPWFPFCLRVTYMLLLRRLLPKLCTCLSPSCHSSPVENWNDGSYPWGVGRGISAWARFNNEYRRLVLDHGAEGFAISTDLTSFFEHISIREFIAGLDTILDKRAIDVSNELSALGELLEAAAFKGRGLPQNMDASRFLADIYLRVVDDRLRAVPELGYLRYVDDIRLVARTRGAVLRGLQELEKQLKAAGLFLNSKKTEIIDANDVDWKNAQQADDDFKLAHCDELLFAATKAQVEECLRIACGEIQVAAKNGKDRLVRAYGNRLLRVAQFSGVRSDACRPLEVIALSGFRSHPGAADKWAEFASPALSQESVQKLLAILRTPDYNAHAWTNMWVIITMARAQSLPGEAMDTLRAVAFDRVQPDYLRGWAAVAFARHGDGLRRREIVDACLTEFNSLFLRRAAVVAAQQLPSTTKSEIRAQTLRRDPMLSILWEYLDKGARYDWYQFSSRDFAEASEADEKIPFYEAEGLVKGRRTKFKAYSRGTNYDERD
jgi:Reverse transcriptase (RNA-dependent DNA polymerase)